MGNFEKKAVDCETDDKRLIMTPEDKTEFNRSKKWAFSRAPFELYPRENGQEFKYKDKVRDHDILTGRVRGDAHSSCNLRHHKTLKIQIFFNNFPDTTPT